MEIAIRLIHWYDIDHHRTACGAPGQSNSTKHLRGVTCTACLARVEEHRADLRIVDAAAAAADC